MSSHAIGRSVLITGTTSGLGLALLEHYVHAGAKVICVNRREVPELAARFPSVRFACVDVRAAEAVDGLIRMLAESGQLPDVFLLNAGINRADNDESFQLPLYREVIETNLFGALNFVAPLSQLPRSPTPRHVVVISSMAHYAGNPYGLGYYTSKKALTACFEVWANMYAGTDLVFQQVMLGPVKTAIYTMDDSLPSVLVGAKRLISASLPGAARAVARFALTRKKKLIYPRRALPFFLALRVGQRLIPGYVQGRRTLAGRARRAKTGP